MGARRPFVWIIGSDEGHVLELLEAIKVELQTNGLLLRRLDARLPTADGRAAGAGEAAETAQGTVPLKED